MVSMVTTVTMVTAAMMVFRLSRSLLNAKAGGS
jgi:hypothetical protein